MNSFEAIIYGIIQGLSEFLPISSSGHLALLPFVMKIQDPGLIFDLVMHLGTALAVITYFRKEIFEYSKTLTPALMDLKVASPSLWFVRNFLFSTFISVLFIVALIPISKLARDPFIIVFNLVFFGALLWVADIYSKKKENLLNSPLESGMQWRIAFVIGMSQAIAIFPGVSRSGITLSAALLLGMRRKEAGAYSFLLSLPIILAGILKEVPHLMTADNERLLVLFWGVLSSFVVGWLTIHFFMKLIGTIQLKYFTFYRWLIAGFMIWLLN